MANYNSSIIAGLRGPNIPGMRRPTQVQGISPMSGLPNPGTLNPDPALDVYNFNESMGNELRTRAFNNARVAGLSGPAYADDPNVAIAKGQQGPLEALRKSYMDENAASAIAQQGKEVDAWRDFDREATSLGFEGQGLGERTLSPGQARNIYARRQGEFEKTIPVLQAEATGRATRDAATIKAQGDMAVKGTEARIEREKLNQYADLARTLGANGGQGTDGRTVSSLSLPGGFRVGYDTNELSEGGIPTRLLTELAFQRYAVNAAKSDKERTAAEGAYIQSQLNALNQARGIDPNLKSWVSDLVVDPGTRDMDFDDIVNAYMAQATADGDGDVPDEAALETARNLFRTLRGR